MNAQRPLAQETRPLGAAADKDTAVAEPKLLHSVVNVVDSEAHMVKSFAFHLDVLPHRPWSDGLTKLELGGTSVRARWPEED